jgi:hypothetical protein
MNSKTRKALMKSIQHWKRLATGKRRRNEVVGPQYCALCEMFIENLGCEGCPVQQATGCSSCGETPYREANRHCRDLDSPVFKEAAAKELKFLKGLLP